MNYTYNRETTVSINKLMRVFEKIYPKKEYDKKAIPLTVLVLGIYLFLLAAAYVMQLQFTNVFGYWTLLFYVIPGIVLAPVFMIQHDCGHGSFHSSQKVRDTIGIVCSLLTNIPYEAWKIEHAIHHLNNGVHKFKSLGDILTYTAKEFLALPSSQKFYYRGFRNPLGFLLLGSILYLFYYQRWPRTNVRNYHSLDAEEIEDVKSKLKESQKSYRLTNVALLVVYGTLTYLLGFQFLLGVIVAIWVFGILAMWVFYTQHQHPKAFKYHLIERELAMKENRSDSETALYHKAALKGSLIYDLPKGLKKFLLYITEHDLHHYKETLMCLALPDMRNFLDKKAQKCPIFREKEIMIRFAKGRSFNEIPSMEMEKIVAILDQESNLCLWMNDQPIRVTFKESLKLIHCHVYDNESKTMISFKELERRELCKLGNHKKMITLPKVKLPNTQDVHKWAIQKQCTCCKAVIEIQEGIQQTIQEGIFNKIPKNQAH